MDMEKDTDKKTETRMHALRDTQRRWQLLEMFSRGAHPFAASSFGRRLW